MCFGGGDSGVDQEAVVKNREIEKVIRADQKKAAREVKLLLLGEQNSPQPPHCLSIPNCLFFSPVSQFPIPTMPSPASLGWFSEGQKGLTMACVRRCRRERKIDSAEADAADLRAGLLEGREGGMARDHIQ